MSTFPDQFRLNGRTALVTGSGRGLGWEMAQGLAQAGATVLLHGRSGERRVVSDAVGQPVSITEARPESMGASISLTLDTCSHVLPHMQEEAAGILDRALTGNRRRDRA